MDPPVHHTEAPVSPLAARLLERDVEPPCVPDKWGDCALEFRNGYAAGWDAGPGREPSPRYKPKWGAFAYNMRAGAFNGGVRNGRDDKRRLIVAVLPEVERKGTPQQRAVNNWPRDGWDWNGLFFYYLGDGRVPCCIPIGPEPMRHGK